MTIRRQDLDAGRIDFSDIATGKRIAPVQPGKILLNEFLKPLGITQYRLAKAIDVPQRRIGEIVAGNRAITADTALRLAEFFNMSARFWLDLQSFADLRKEEREFSKRSRNRIVSYGELLQQGLVGA